MWTASCGELLGRPEAGRERHRGAERVALRPAGSAPSSGVLKSPGAIVHTRTPPTARSRAAGSVIPTIAALRGRVGDLADLAVEGGDRGGVDAHAALAVVVGLVAEHRAGGEAQDVEGADQVDADHGLEGLELVRRRAGRRPSPAQPTPAQQTLIRSPPGSAGGCRPRRPATSSGVGHVGLDEARAARRARRRAPGPLLVEVGDRHDGAVRVQAPRAWPRRGPRRRRRRARRFLRSALGAGAYRAGPARARTARRGRCTSRRSCRPGGREVAPRGARA